MSAWADTVAALWPDSEVGTGPGERAAREFVFLPSAERPRLLLPAGLPGAAAAALRRYSHDLGPRQRVTRALTTAAVRAGFADRALRDRLHVSGDGESVEDRLGEILGRPVVVSVGLGSARANRKPILHALTPRGEPAAFVKVGDTAMARELIDGEAAALAALAARSFGTLRVPEVLHHGEWRGLGLLVLSPLPTGALSFRSRGSAPVAAMRELTGDARRLPLTASPFWTRFLDVPLDDPGQGERLAGVVARAGEAYSGDEVAFGAWHGDWTPWNMAWHGGRVQLWDWERYDECVPAGLDLLHYRLQTGGGYDAWPDPEILAPLGLTGRAAAITVELYLLELTRRYLLAAQGPLGEPLREQAARPARPAARQGREDGMISRRDAPQWVKDGGRALSRTAGRLSAGRRALPGFLLVGTQRAGTTSLFRALAEHPGAAPPNFHKGVHYFDVNYARGQNWYRGHFPLRSPESRTAFESAGYYMHHPLAPGRIAADLPGVKLLVLLRDPVERAYSAHKHELARGFETEASFERALELEPERLAGEVDRIREEPGYLSHSHRHHSYLDRGHYADQLDVLFQLFGRDRVHVAFAEDFFTEPEPCYDAVAGFLGSPSWQPAAFERHNARPGSPAARRAARAPGRALRVRTTSVSAPSWARSPHGAADVRETPLVAAPAGRVRRPRHVHLGRYQGFVRRQWPVLLVAALLGGVLGHGTGGDHPPHLHLVRDRAGPARRRRVRPAAAGPGAVRPGRAEAGAWTPWTPRRSCRPRVRPGRAEEGPRLQRTAGRSRPAASASPPRRTPASWSSAYAPTVPATRAQGARAIAQDLRQAARPRHRQLPDARTARRQPPRSSS